MFIKRLNKTIFSILILGQLVAPLSTFASGPKPENRNDNSNAAGIKWARRNFRALSSGGAGYDIKALYVIKEYENQVHFTQYGISKNKDGSTLNLGLGINHLVPKATLPFDIIVGGNIFYDTKAGTDNLLYLFSKGLHKRVSVGGTIKTSQADAFLNIYRGLTGFLAGYKASDGYDIGVNGLLPGYENIKLGMSNYNFNEENKGNKFKVEYTPNTFLTFGMEYDHSGVVSESPSTSLYVQAKYKFNTSFEEQLKPISNANRNVWDQRYDEVERNNTLILEVAETPFVESTLGQEEFKAMVDDTTYLIDGKSVFKTVKLSDLDGYVNNGQDLVYELTQVDANPDGSAWPDDKITVQYLTDATKNCIATESTTIYIKKGTECTLDITFKKAGLIEAVTDTIKITTE